VDLDLTFDIHGNALDKGHAHLDTRRRLHDGEKDGAEDRGEMGYYCLSDEHVAVRYPPESPPLAAMNRPRSPHRTGPAKLQEIDMDKEKANASRHRQRNQRTVYHMDDRGSEVSPQHLQRSPTPALPSRITSHQLFEYKKAIRAIRSIQSGLDSHRPWLFDAAAADTKIVRLQYLLLLYDVHHV
jgi:hypothetical protein